MSKIYLLSSFLFIAGMYLGQGQAGAQIKMPQPSPNASVMQVVGVTEIKVTYAAPGVKGREIWGKLLPYDSLWRAGANSPTRISFNTDVKIDGKEVKKGEYTLMAIPTAKKWTMILNKDSKGNGVFTYHKADDVLRFQVTPEKKSTNKERLAYYINPDSEEKGTVTLRWEKMAVSFVVETNPKKELDANIKDFIGQNWFTLASAAQYYTKNDQDTDTALKLADAALALGGENLFTVWVKAQVMAKKGEKNTAIELAKKAQKMGQESKGGFANFYKNVVKSPLEASLKDWKK